MAAAEPTGSEGKVEIFILSIVGVAFLEDWRVSRGEVKLVEGLEIILSSSTIAVDDAYTIQLLIFYYSVPLKYLFVLFVQFE